MLLRQIKFYNFRGFKGEHILDLNCNQDKNIIVILGDNTDGKSTIVQAFAWCFYGLRNFENPEIIYNRKLAEEIPNRTDIEIYVEIEFEHDNTLYTAKRTKTYFKNFNNIVVEKNEKFSLIKIDNETGQPFSCGTTPVELAEAMNSILPQELSEFFFFEGEKRNEITAKGLSNAVKKLMGIEAYQKMKEHLYGTNLHNDMSTKSVLSKLKSKMMENKTSSFVDIENKIAKLEEENITINTEIDSLEKQKKNYEDKINDIKNILSSLEETRKLQEERKNNEEDLSYTQNELKGYFKDFLEAFENNSLDMLIMAKIKQANARLDKMEISDKTIPGIEGPAILALLERGVCLCGTDLKEGSLAYKKVEEYLDIIPPKQIGSLVRGIQEKMEDSIYYGKEYAKKVDNIYKKIQSAKLRIDKIERNQEEISSKLKKSSNQNISQYEKDLELYKDRINNINISINNKNRKLWENEREYQEVKKERDMILSKSKKNKLYARYYSYAQGVYDWVMKEYEKREKLTRDNLQKTVSELFNKIYTGNRKVIIDNEYNMTLIPKADTGSLKTIQYFSYIGGIVKLASDFMKDKKNNNGLGEEYPLVLDAAFSTTDTKHTKSIAQELSKVTNQLIFAVMDKDWQHVENNINEKIGKTYRLIKIDEDEISFKEEK